MFHYVPKQCLIKEIRVYCKFQTHNLGDQMNRKFSKEDIEECIDEVKKSLERWCTENKIKVINIYVLLDVCNGNNDDHHGGGVADDDGGSDGGDNDD